MWSRVQGVFEKSNASLKLFRFTYALATSGEGKGRGEFEKKSSSVRFGEISDKTGSATSAKLETCWFPPVALTDHSELKIAVEAKMENSVQALLNPSSVKLIQEDEVLQFCNLSLQTFTDLETGSDALDRFVEPEILSYYSADNSSHCLDLHVKLCVALLNRFADESTKKSFYEKLTKLDNPDWISSFIGGLLQASDIFRNKEKQNLCCKT